MAGLNQFLLVIGLFFVLSLATAVKKSRECTVDCVRTEKLQKVGYDLNLGILTVDVGDCQSIVKNVTTEGECDYELIEEDEACLKRCIPRAYEKRIISERDGPKEVLVVKSCYPTYHHCLPSCQRRPHNIYFFPDSKYREKVDVGKCVGGCNVTDSSCVAVRNKSVAIEGPNGAIAVDVIESCECTYPGCYRADYTMSFWDYSGLEGKREEKAINVGRCVGGCPGVLLDDTCLPSKDNCIILVPGGPTQCAPTQTGSDTYTNKKNEVKTVPTITDCGCISG